MIWKSPLNLQGDLATVVRARYGKILHVGHDANGVPSMWYWAASTESDLESRTMRVVVVGTGNAYEGEPSDYIGTFTYRSLVLHAFVEKVL